MNSRLRSSRVKLRSGRSFVKVKVRRRAWNHQRVRRKVDPIKAADTDERTVEIPRVKQETKAGNETGDRDFSALKQLAAAVRLASLCLASPPVPPLSPCANGTADERESAPTVCDRATNVWHTVSPIFINGGHGDGMSTDSKELGLSSAPICTAAEARAGMEGALLRLSNCAASGGHRNGGDSALQIESALNKDVVRPPGYSSGSDDEELRSQAGGAASLVAGGRCDGGGMGNERRPSDNELPNKMSCDTSDACEDTQSTRKRPRVDSIVDTICTPAFGSGMFHITSSASPMPLLQLAAAADSADSGSQGGDNRGGSGARGMSESEQEDVQSGESESDDKVGSCGPSRATSPGPLFRRRHVSSQGRCGRLRSCSGHHRAKWVMDPEKAYKGVCITGGTRWRASIYAGGDRMYLGTYGSAERAARAYDDALERYKSLSSYTRTSNFRRHWFRRCYCVFRSQRDIAVPPVTRDAAPQFDGTPSEAPRRTMQEQSSGSSIKTEKATRKATRERISSKGGSNGSGSNGRSLLRAITCACGRTFDIRGYGPHKRFCGVIKQRRKKWRKKVPAVLSATVNDAVRRAGLRQCAKRGGSSGSGSGSGGDARHKRRRAAAPPAARVKALPPSTRAGATIFKITCHRCKQMCPIFSFGLHQKDCARRYGNALERVNISTRSQKREQEAGALTRAQLQEKVKKKVCGRLRRYPASASKRRKAIGYSRYRGVTKHIGAPDTFSARISYNKKTRRIGRFDSETAAAHAYDIAALIMQGPVEAQLNFSCLRPQDPQDKITTGAMIPMKRRHRVRVYWTGEKCWFNGHLRSYGTGINQNMVNVDYEDGKTMCHNFDLEAWEILSVPPLPEQALRDSS